MMIDGTVPASHSKRPAAFRIALPIHLCLIGVVYSGAFPFLVHISPYLLYGFYVALALSLVLCTRSLRCAAEASRSVSPYLLWLAIYALWGTAVSPDPAFVLPEVIRMFAQNLLFAAGVAVALWDVRHLSSFCRTVQICAIANFALCVWEVPHPALVSSLALTLSPDNHAFNLLRPAGLWTNPNESAFAFLFALLLSYWCRGALAWIGRIACIGGIYLGASRTGLYLLVLCAGLYPLLQVHPARLGRVQVAVLLNGLALVACLFLTLDFNDTLSGVDASDNYTMTRALDYSESGEKRAEQDTRLSLASTAADYALDEFWVGHGVFTFQGYEKIWSHPSLSEGCHDIYIAVWGETGILGALAYLMVLGIGVRRVFTAEATRAERSILIALWTIYLIIGFTWHNQLTSAAGMVYAALLFCLPQSLAASTARSGAATAATR